MILGENPERKRSLGNTRSRCKEDNIKLDLKHSVCESARDGFGSGQRSLTDCEQFNELSDVIKARQFIR
jgi:hypothetical protein